MISIKYAMYVHIIILYSLHETTESSVCSNTLKADYRGFYTNTFIDCDIADGH